jgi:catechol 2,3-dioxygenase-like lactoylglutathione lyase family enzyme
MGLKLERMCIVLDSDNSEGLSAFYEKLLGWTRHEHKADDEWIAVSSDKKDGTPLLLFQQTEGYKKPVWPNTAGKQQQMIHLDFHVTDLNEGVEYALSCGAELSTVQLEDHWRVMLDPAGHPFCVLPK